MASTTPLSSSFESPDINKMGSNKPQPTISSSYTLQQQQHQHQQQPQTFTQSSSQQQQQQELQQTYHQQHNADGMQFQSSQPSVMQSYGGQESSSQQYQTSQQYQVIDEQQMQREYTGEGRLVSVTSRVDESRSHILEEEYVEHEIRVPRRIVREEVIEKVIVVPEKRQTEEIVEDLCKVRERIIKIAKPTIIEKIVEIPEIEYVEKIIEVPERIVQEKIVEVDKIITEERVVDVPKVEYIERSYEVVDDSLPVQYRDYQVDKVVEIEDWRDEIIIREVVVPQYVDKPQPIYVDKEVTKNIPVDVPLPVEAEITYEFTLPHLQPNFHKVTYPVYLPRFIEVPVAAELLTPQLNYLAENFRAQIKALENGASTTVTGETGSTHNAVTPVSLQEIEELATQIMKTDFQTQLSSVDLQSAVMNAWQKGTLPVKTDSDVVPTVLSRSTMQETHSRPAVTTVTSTSPSVPPVRGSGVVSTTTVRRLSHMVVPTPRLAENSTVTTTVYRNSQPISVSSHHRRRSSRRERKPSANNVHGDSDSRKPSFNPLYPIAQATGSARIVKPVNVPMDTSSRVNVVY